MRNLLSWYAFDALLRGRLDASDRVRLLGSWLCWQIFCAAIFGASLGVYALTTRAPADPRFLLAGAVKIPLLLIFTSVITVPSLYVFGALRGLRFSAREFGAHLMVAHTILAAVLGSLAPVITFFALTTTSYPFMVLLDVFACALAGLFGVRVFVRALNEPAPQPEAPPEEGAPTPQPRVDSGAWQLLGWWLALYMFVGAQVGWILRPYIGRPDLPWVLLRGKQGGFIEGVLHNLGQLLKGD